MTFYQRTGRHDDAMQCCYDAEQSQSLKDSKKWNSFVIEVCENFQVGKNDYINLNLHNYVLQMENVGRGSFQFSSTYLASLDKLLEIMTQDFDESSVFTSTDVFYSILHKMDQALYQLESVTHSRCRKAVSHFKGQLYMWCATLLNKRSESDLGPHSDRSKLAFLLFAGAYSADMSAQYWATGGARKVMSGHMLGLLAGTPNWNMEMLSGLDCNTGFKLYDTVFMSNRVMIKSSYLAQHSLLANITSLPTTAEIGEHCIDYVTKYKCDLHQLVWLLARYHTPGKIIDLSFQLPWNWTKEDNNYLDMSSFLYSIVYASGWKADKLKKSNVPLTPMLATRMTNDMQEAWWRTAVKLENGEEVSPAEQFSYQCGLGIIRCSRTQGLDINLTMMLGRTYANLASAQEEESVVKKLFIDRAALYYKASLEIVESFQKKGFENLRLDGLTLFHASGNFPNKHSLLKMKKIADAFLIYHKIQESNFASSESITRVVELQDGAEEEVHYNLLARDKYHHWLFKEVLHLKDKLSSSVVTCNLYGKSGSVVKIPLFMLSTAWPLLREIVDIVPCCEESVDISLPDVAVKTLEAVKELVITGNMSKSENSEEIQSLKKDYHFCLSVEKVYIPQVNLEGNIFQNIIENVMFEKTTNQPERTLQSEAKSNCSKVCSNSCHNTLKSWPREDVKRLEVMFNSEKKIDTKQNLLNHLKSQKNVGLAVSSYIVHGHAFCFKYLSTLTGISEYVVGAVLNDFHSGIEIYQHGNVGSLQHESTATIRAVCWVKAFSEAFGQSSPEQNCIVLSHWLTKKSLFNIYIEETTGPHVSQSQFYSLFKSKFGHNRLDKSLPWVRISKYSTHSVCSVCVALNSNQKQCKTQGELKQAKERFQYKKYFIENKKIQLESYLSYNLLSALN